MPRIIRPSILLLLVLFSTTCYIRPKKTLEWDAPFFFIQMADPQFGMYHDPSFKEETERFETALFHANRLKPAFVVVCGDMIQDPMDTAQTGRLLSIAEKLDKRIPLYWVAGNHDIGYTPDTAALAWYRKSFGRDRYVFYHSGCTFVVVNSPIIYGPSKVAQEASAQKEWLEKTLKASQTRASVHTVVFQHFPWFLKAPDEADTIFNIPATVRQDYLKMLVKYKVTATFSGHYHRNALGKYKDMEMVTTGPLSKPAGKDPAGLRIVKVFKDRIEHAYYGLDAVPRKIDLTVKD